MASKQAQPDTPPHSPNGYSSSKSFGLPQSIISEARWTIKEPFAPEKHVRFEPPKKILSMKELGFGTRGISPNAVSEPFRLFSDSAIEQMRAEVFSEQVLEKCHSSSAFAANQVRGAGARLAPFIHTAWNSPEVLAAVSQVAGVDLIPVFDYDTGHCNISVRPDGYHPNTEEDTQENVTAFGWHEDCFPFVCVLMLSDCTDMIGGETMLKTGNGDFLKVRGPSMGTCVVMQGRYISHQALKARGGRERISMVTSFRPRDPHAKDESFLGGVRKISHVPTLYQQYTEYRLENLERRVRSELKNVRKQGRSGRDFDYVSTRKWLTEQKEYIESMIAELQDPEHY